MGDLAIALSRSFKTGSRGRARIGLSFVTGSRPMAESLLEKIQDFVESNTDAVVSGWTSELMEFEG